jgi:RNA polymerase sigma-70 factor (ECF subfamily)
MARARPERGRFRTFLVSALRHFLANEWHRSQAAKRGSGQAVLSLDFKRGDERYARDPADPGLTPEQALDRSWALELLDQATGALREDYEKSGRGPLFAALAPMLWGNGTEESVAASAARLGMTADAFSVALYRMRRRFGERLRAIVADTVAAPEDLDAELRHLIDAVGGSAHDP